MSVPVKRWYFEQRGNFEHFVCIYLFAQQNLYIIFFTNYL